MRFYLAFEHGLDGKLSYYRLTLTIALLFSTRIRSVGERKKKNDRVYLSRVVDFYFQSSSHRDVSLYFFFFFSKILSKRRTSIRCSLRTAQVWWKTWSKGKRWREGTRFALYLRHGTCWLLHNECNIRSNV